MQEPYRIRGVKNEASNGMDLNIKEEHIEIKEEPLDVEQEVEESRGIARRGEKRALPSSLSPDSAPEAKKQQLQVEVVRSRGKETPMPRTLNTPVASPMVPAGPADVSHHRCAARSSVAMESVRPGSSTNFGNQMTPKEKVYACDQCGRVFADKSNLRRHIVTHTGEKNFECLECGKKFTRKGDLPAHMLIHTGEKNFECLECGKKFTHKSHLKTHMVTHTGEKNFECLECGKTFTQKGNLNNHMVTHTGVKNFECQECKKKFTRKSHLETHMLTHTGLWPFL